MTALPADLSELVRLRYLDIARNLFTALPDGLERLTALETLNLCNNELTRLPEHYRRVIQDGAIYDPRNLIRLLRGEPWTTVGASNAGCADTLPSLHKAFMHSAEHRANILNRDVRRIGIGVIKVNARNACGRHSFWETQLFYG